MRSIFCCRWLRDELFRYAERVHAIVIPRAAAAGRGQKLSRATRQCFAAFFSLPVLLAGARYLHMHSL